MNLTRLTSPRDFWIKHICDSLAIGRFRPEIFTQPWKICDVGCGAGFPLFPLAWTNTSGTFIGIEATGKKADFVSEAAAELGLHNVRTVHATAGEAVRLSDYRRKFDGVLLRAVGNPDKLIPECRQLLKNSAALGMVFYMTPKSLQQNLAATARTAKKCGLRTTSSDAFELPDGAGTRQFLLVHSG